MYPDDSLAFKITAPPAAPKGSLSNIYIFSIIYTAETCYPWKDKLSISTILEGSHIKQKNKLFIVYIM